MSRIINPNSAGKQRNKLTRKIALAVRELAQKKAIDNESKDIAAFISISLHEVAETIEPTVEAWEKRNYWVKADKFRMEWRWAEKYSTEMRAALLADDWASVANVAMQTATKLQKIKISPRHRLGRPWTGSWWKLEK